MLATSNEHIATTPDTCGGKPRIAGSRIRVQDVVTWHQKMGLSPDEIVSQYPILTLAALYAALAYYHDNFDRIRQDLAESAETVEKLRQTNPSKLQAKLNQTA
jgi:uncharacterized protein (DUF433 family)